MAETANDSRPPRLLESARSSTTGDTVAIRFADCILDVDARRVVRGAREVHLSPKAFELLQLLVQHRPRAVSKAELLDRVWPGVFVSDGSLAKVVSKIREAIGDCEDPPIVRTVHGYGYAFAATIDDERPRAESVKPLRQPVCWLFCGGREFPLHDGEHIVGREPNAAICLNSPNVSRRHARFVVNGRRIFAKGANWIDRKRKPESKRGPELFGLLPAGISARPPPRSAMATTRPSRIATSAGRWPSAVTTVPPRRTRSRSESAIGCQIIGGFAHVS